MTARRLLPSIALVVLAAARADTVPIHDAMKLVYGQQEAWNRGDLAGFMAGYWKSPELTFVSGGKVTTGWDATMDRYKKRYQSDGKEMGKLAFSELKGRSVSETFYVVTGRWDLTLSKSPEKPGGRFTLFVERKPEGWRVTYDHTSADEK
jgi:hypothetical protein